MATTEIRPSAVAAHLRAVADLIERLDLPAPPTGAVSIRFDLEHGSRELWISGCSRDELVRALRAIPGKVHKLPTATGFIVWGHALDEFGSVEINASVKNRDEVCRRVVVGQRDVPEQVIPGHIEDVVEWECDPLLADRDDDTQP